MDISKLKPDNAKAIGILVAIIAVVVIGAWIMVKFFGGIGSFFSSITDGLGITDSPETKAKNAAIQKAKDDANNPNSPWSPLYYQSAPTGAKLITQEAADSVAKEIWDSVGFWSGWNIDEVIDAIHKLNYKSQVSYVADRFSSNYGKDLLTWITMQYTAPLGGADPGILIVTNYVAGLPAYGN